MTDISLKMLQDIAKKFGPPGPEIVITEAAIKGKPARIPAHKSMFHKGMEREKIIVHPDDYKKAMEPAKPVEPKPLCSKDSCTGIPCKICWPHLEGHNQHMRLADYHVHN